MADKSPGAGRYKLLARSWDRMEGNSRVRYHEGDEVDLTDAEARRLAGSRHLKSAVKVDTSPKAEEAKPEQAEESAGESDSAEQESSTSSRRSSRSSSSSEGSDKK